jgi:Flp pilus assembly protein TadG
MIDMNLGNASSNLRAGRQIRSIRNDARGTALVEFAITLPVLLILYLGCVQICEVVSVYRKATTTARTLADLTSQFTEVTNNDITTVMNASSQIMAPYSNAQLQMVITHLSINNSGVATVTWSKPSANGAVADTTGSTYTLPTGAAVNNTSIIVAKVTYRYQARIGGFLETDIPLADTIYMYPRSSNSIPNV